MSVDIRLNNTNYLGIEEIQMPTVQGGSATFEEPKTLGTKTITENGTYLASTDEFDGFSEVEVNVSGGGSSAPDYTFVDGGETDTVLAQSTITFNKQSTSLDFTGVDTSGITHMQGMFVDCPNLTTLNLTSFNTTNVTNMNTMFSTCPLLTSLDVSSFDTRNVTTMMSLFKYCNSLTNLDLSNFNTGNVVSMREMFKGCSSLQTLDIRNFDFSALDYTLGTPPIKDIFRDVPSTCTIYVNQAGYDLISANASTMGLADVNMLQVV